MSKKDFIALANMIIAARRSNPAAFRNGEVTELATFCRNQNPLFKADRWFDYIDGKCGANGGKVRQLQTA